MIKTPLLTACDFGNVNKEAVVLLSDVIIKGFYSKVLCVLAIGNVDRASNILCTVMNYDVIKDAEQTNKPTSHLE